MPRSLILSHTHPVLQLALQSSHDFLVLHSHHTCFAANSGPFCWLHWLLPVYIWLRVYAIYLVSVWHAAVCGFPAYVTFIANVILWLGSANVCHKHIALQEDGR